MKTRLLLIASALLCLAGPVFPADELRWGADTESGAPYSFHDPDNFGNIIGFEADIIKAVAREMKREPLFVQNGWGSLIPGLDRRLYDVAVNGLEISPEHERAVNFSDPYYICPEQLVARKNSSGINSLSDCRGKPVGTLKHSVAAKILDAAGGIKVQLYEKEVDAFFDLANGRLDAVLIDAPVALYYAGPNPALKFIGEGVGGVKYGIAVRKDDPETLRQINAALKKLKTSGELRSILERWNLWNPLIAGEFADYSQSGTEPSEYLRFVRRQNPQLSFAERMARYKSFLPYIGKALSVTIEVSLAAMVLAVALGFLVALVRIYAPPQISWLAMVYVEVIRGTPLLIQLFFIFYGLPGIGIKLSPFVAGVIGLGLNYSAYEAENYRAGLFAVPRGQMEAALALGMTRWEGLRHIIIPQATRIVLPPMTNDFISLLKDSSLVSMITLVELTGAYGQLSTAYYDYFGTGILISAIYLLIGLPFVRLARWLEAKMRAGLQTSHNPHL